MKTINSLFQSKTEENHKHDFDAIRIGMASPEMIKEWSHGEVTKPETINYRTFKPEKGGLFCEVIFGPTKDWECSCGKYKRVRMKNVTCDRCGVDVTLSKVRRERMGHIDLVIPVTHIWYFKGVPSKMAYLLDITTKKLERVIYYESYIVIDKGTTPLKDKQLLTIEDYDRAREKYGNSFTASIGAEAVKIMLEKLDLDAFETELTNILKTSRSQQRRKDAVKKVKVVRAFRNSSNKPEWMVLDYVPVIPPEMRPLVPLDGGRFATSDLNDLYRRVINRNNRLKKLLDLNAPEVIIRNEKRMLQESVDALFDNGRRGSPVRGTGNRPLKSLSEMLKGKQGRFRQNLLGKRVDYSGRSVIVVGPELKIHECGLPKAMALELFKPFIIRKLEEKGYVHTIKSAKKMVDNEKPEVWDILEEVLEDHPVLLNRAPTLHRQGIQAFQPKLIEGKALRIHPLVCAGFNADFDGDQMAVHVPLTIEAQMEVRTLIMSTNNILSSASGRPIAVPSQDIVLGCYYLTMERRSDADTEPTRIFDDYDEIILAVTLKQLDLHDKILFKHKDKKIITTTGRVIFNSYLPEALRFTNKKMNKKNISVLVEDAIIKLGHNGCASVLDTLKVLGYKYSTEGGLSISVSDLKIPEIKTQMVAEADKNVKKINTQYQQGIITDSERYNKVIDIWSTTTDNVAEQMMQGMISDADGFNPVYLMADSGARGSKAQIRQLAGMRGLMAKPQQRLTGATDEIIENPIIANFREGLNVLEYFISTHGARKGLADTALKTADAGYLTRKLVDVVQEMIITEEDCGTIRGIGLSAIKEGSEIIEPLKDRILGRVVLDNVVDLLTDEVLVKAGEEIDDEKANQIEDSGIERIKVRSVLTCESQYGVCAKCYGRNLLSRKMAEHGDAIGTIAAQSIGEPGTQLTLRTFHIGGTASRVLEQSKNIAENSGKIVFKNLKIIKDRNGDQVVVNRNGEIGIQDKRGIERETHKIQYGSYLSVTDGQEVKKGDALSSWDLYSIPIFAETEGTVEMVDIIDGVTMNKKLDSTTGLVGRVIVEQLKDKKLQPMIVLRDKQGEQLAKYSMPVGAYLVVEDNQIVVPGDVLAKLPREISKTSDITGGLPRVAELFEARKPKNMAVISEIDGTVRFAGTKKNKHIIKVINEETEETCEYKVPFGKHLNVYDGDYVRAGDELTEGQIDPHDILKVKGLEAVQEYLVNNIQEVYRLQGVTLNDKHIEVIIRAMLKKVQIEDPGDTDYLEGSMVDRFQLRKANEKFVKAKKKPAKGKPVLLGITKAALGAESFLSAASFQETTKVLTEAAINQKVDHLRGLKENVTIGHLISAGTGVFPMKKIEPVKPKEESAEEAATGPLEVEIVEDETS